MNSVIQTTKYYAKTGAETDGTCKKDPPKAEGLCLIIH